MHDVGKAFQTQFMCIALNSRTSHGLRVDASVLTVRAKHPVSVRTALYQFSLCTALSHHLQTPVHFDGFFSERLWEE